MVRVSVTLQGDGERRINAFSQKDGVIVPSDVTRISCDHNYPLKFIDKLCGYLQCQPGDIIAYIPENEAGISLGQVMAGM